MEKIEIAHPKETSSADSDRTLHTVSGVGSLAEQSYSYDRFSVRRVVYPDIDYPDISKKHGYGDTKAVEFQLNAAGGASAIKIALYLNSNNLSKDSQKFIMKCCGHQFAQAEACKILCNHVLRVAMEKGIDFGLASDDLKRQVAVTLDPHTAELLYRLREGAIRTASGNLHIEKKETAEHSGTGVRLVDGAYFGSPLPAMWAFASVPS